LGRLVRLLLVTPITLWKTATVLFIQYVTLELLIMFETSVRVLTLLQWRWRHLSACR